MVRIQELDSVPLAVVRRQARASDLPRLVPECCGLVWDVIRAQRARGGRHVAIYWDASIRLEVGVEIEGAFTSYFGSYQTLDGAHTAIREWCGVQGLRLAGPNWEVYGHWRNEWNADPSQIRTDVFYQLLPK